MRTALLRFMENDSGATAIEYGLIAALISVAIISSLQGIRDRLVANFETISAALPAAATAGK
jgi:pilus assembly protein Flp/PilA